MSLDLDTGAKIAEIFVPVFSVTGLGWWLRGKLQDIKDFSRDNMEAHEEKDQTRHMQNLRRFSIIGVSLAKIKPDLDLNSLSDTNGN